MKSILPYSGMDLRTKEGQDYLMDFVKESNLGNVTYMEAVRRLWDIEESMAEEALNDLLETQRDAMPNPWS